MERASVTSERIRVLLLLTHPDAAPIVAELLARDPRLDVRRQASADWSPRLAFVDAPLVRRGWLEGAVPACLLLEEDDNPRELLSSSGARTWIRKETDAAAIGRALESLLGTVRGPRSLKSALLAAVVDRGPAAVEVAAEPLAVQQIAQTLVAVIAGAISLAFIWMAIAP